MAVRVREGLGTNFDVRLGRWHDKPIGPHPIAMYQVAFSPELFGKVVPWLMLNREGLDILIHPTTGDDVADHTDHALWLGEKLELNIEFLRADKDRWMKERSHPTPDPSVVDRFPSCDFTPTAWESRMTRAIALVHPRACTQELAPKNAPLVQKK